MFFLSFGFNFLKLIYKPFRIVFFLSPRLFLIASISSFVFALINSSSNAAVNKDNRSLALIISLLPDNKTIKINKYTLNTRRYIKIIDFFLSKLNNAISWSETTDKSKPFTADFKTLNFCSISLFFSISLIKNEISLFSLKIALFNSVSGIIEGLLRITIEPSINVES